MNKTAIIVINHNLPVVTDSLCDNIKTHTKSPYDLYVVETGSDLKNLSRNASLWVRDGIRMTRGFNIGIHYAKWQEKLKGDVFYDKFWLLVNDAKLFNCDTLSSLSSSMASISDCGQIHPFINNSPLSVLRKCNKSGTRKVSFVEIICPLISRKVIDANVLDDRFFYGWGLDYEIPYLIHKLGMRTYISDDVGVIHNAGTTVSMNKDNNIKTVSEQFDKSRANMVDVLVSKYGDNWAKLFLDGIPPDVSNEAYRLWVCNIGRDLKV